jgi:outer membrane cobalamin receptor
MKNGIDWKKPTTIGVIIFLLLISFLFSQESEAETAIELSAGATFVASDKFDSETLFIIEKFDEKKYQVGLVIQTRLHCIDECKRGSSGQNQAIFIQRVTHLGNWKMGLGISYWHNQTPAWNSNTPYVLSAGYKISDNFDISWRHFSTGGSSSSNGGLDMLTIGYEF